MSKNVLIPLDLLVRISDLFIYWDISQYDRSIRDEYHSIRSELDVKMLKLDLRESYSKILQAKDEDAKHSARMVYLWKRNHIADGFRNDFST